MCAPFYKARPSNSDPSNLPETPYSLVPSSIGLTAASNVVNLGELYSNYSTPRFTSSGTSANWRLFLTKQPTQPEVEVDSVDSKYFHFFLGHMDKILTYADLLPGAVDEIFVRATQSDVLRHTTLALSSFSIDGFLNRPLTRALIHKQKAL